MKFRFHQDVMVTNGFYRGQTGYIRKHRRTLLGGHQYYVDVPRSVKATRWYKQEDLIAK